METKHLLAGQLEVVKSGLHMGRKWLLVVVPLGMLWHLLPFLCRLDCM